jgi:hypothetical protein
MVVTDHTGLVPVERVRCLECGVPYVKPCGGNTMRRNPGCPRCGYVGWISAFVPLDDTALSQPTRSASRLEMRAKPSRGKSNRSRMR